ncbi:MAG: DUF4345 family protein [Mariniblastus sp.]
MIAKIYLIAAALVYFALAIWCSVSPGVTSDKVGFELKGGSGQSEFMTVYGGLEFGLALILLCSVFRSDTTTFGLIACILIHGSLVLFRTISIFLFDGIEPMTYKLATGEWVIFLLGLAILWFSRNSNA